MTVGNQTSEADMMKKNYRVQFWQGFWWWFDPKRNDWFVGNAPHYGVPDWARLP